MAPSPRRYTALSVTRAVPAEVATTFTGSRGGDAPSHSGSARPETSTIHVSRARRPPTTYRRAASSAGRPVPAVTRGGSAGGAVVVGAGRVVDGRGTVVLTVDDSAAVVELVAEAD